MNVLTRAGWLASAAVSGALLLSFLSLDFAGPWPFALLVAIAVCSFARPAWALPLVTALIPIAWFSASKFWNFRITWAEVLACAALTGLSLDALRGRRPVPRLVAAPAAVFAAIVIAGLAASLRVLALRGGEPFWHELTATMTREYFVDHSLGAVHAGLLLLEGTLLYVHAARLCTEPGVLRRVLAATVLGSTVAAACTFYRLIGAAARGASFWAALAGLSGTLRWNVHYADWNAAGSVYALALLAAVALAVSSRGLRRAIWIVCAIATALGLWITGSRIAVIAVPAAAIGALMLPLAMRGKRQTIAAGAAALALCAALALVSVALPHRGIQQSTWLALESRTGLIVTGVHMIRAYPAFGIGLGEFEQRSGEFSSPELLAVFPAAVHENAHNNVVQVTAELGLPGGLAFVILIGAGLALLAWRAATRRDWFLLLVFAAVAAYAVTALAGHPLLIPEAAFAFWIAAGAAIGAAIGDRPREPRSRRTTVLTAVALALVAITTPLRLAAAARDANLEHVGIGVSAWQVSPDGIRYREGMGRATLFIATGASKFSVSARTAGPVRLELSVDGRIADVVVLTPGHWTDIVVPARTTQTNARFRRLDLSTIDDPAAILWLTKAEPVLPR